MPAIFIERNISMYPDRIFINGKIYTMDKANSIAEALAEKDGCIMQIGLTEDIMAIAGPDTEVIDLKGQTVIPGLQDNHAHPYAIGSYAASLNLLGKNKDEILEMVASAAKNAAEGAWIRGYGWNNALFPEGKYPCRKDLDEVSFGHPVYLTRYCGNGFWANSIALKAAGIDENTPDPEGEILKDEEGMPTGILAGFAALRVNEAVPEPEGQVYKAIILKAQETFLAYGVTGIMDEGAEATSAMGDGNGKRYLTNLKELYESGDMKLRCSEAVCQVQTELFEECLAEGPVTGLYGDRLDIKAVKIWTDGAMGMRTAWIPDGYSDNPENIGQPHYKAEDLTKILKKIDDAGFQTTIHGIGSGACKQILDCYEEAFGDEVKDRRFKIEHFHLGLPEDLDRMVKHGIINSTQFIQYGEDLAIVEKAIGLERFKTCYAWREILDKGGIICGGDDEIGDAVNPFPAMYVAVTRKYVDGKNLLTEHPEKEALTREEALRAYTTSGAYARFKEDVAGSLEEGKYADFAVIDRDYFTCPEEDIIGIKVLRTVIAGETVYEA